MKLGDSYSVYIFINPFSLNKKEECIMYNLIVRARNNDNEAMMKLIEKFCPLITGYAKKLNYEDAYEDVRLEFIRIIKLMEPDRMRETHDGAVVSYIRKCMSNFYKKKVQKAIRSKKEIVFSDLTEEQTYYVDAQLATMNEENIFIEFGMNRLLNAKEEKVLYLIYVKGNSAADIAKEWHKSRQAVNQLKMRAIQKVMTAMKN